MVFKIAEREGAKKYSPPRETTKSIVKYSETKRKKLNEGGELALRDRKYGRRVIRIEEPCRSRLALVCTNDGIEPFIRLEEPRT